MSRRSLHDGHQFDGQVPLHDSNLEDPVSASGYHVPVHSVESKNDPAPECSGFGFLHRSVDQRGRTQGLHLFHLLPTIRVRFLSRLVFIK